MIIYDITRSLNDNTPVWPGDAPFRFTRNWRIADGAAVNLGSISLSVHAGTHADAPLHFQDDGRSIAELDLSVYVGRATVATVSGCDLITVQDIVAAISTADRGYGDASFASEVRKSAPETTASAALALAPRLLLRTSAWQDPATFPTQFPVIAPDVPGFLRSQGVILLGLDVPSVDLFDSKDLPNHHALHANGIHILESLVLDGVPSGNYDLTALPLKIEGSDGSPIRAILRYPATRPD